MQVKAETIRSTTTTQLPYLLYLPDEYDESSNQKWPILLFLHGAGERGSDLELLKTQGLPKKLESGDSIPFIVIAPQCPLEDWWADYRETLIILLDTILTQTKADKNRVYLSGLSMGGRGTWDLATIYPDRFAAIIPICGWGDALFGYPQRLQRIQHIPVWAFHGDADAVVPVAGTQELINSLQEYGGTARLTIYPGVDHDSWTETYNNPLIYQWLLEHSLG